MNSSLFLDYFKTVLLERPSSSLSRLITITNEFIVGFRSNHWNLKALGKSYLHSRTYWPPARSLPLGPIPTLGGLLLLLN